MLGEPEGPEGPEGPGGREELNGERIHPGAGWGGVSDQSDTVPDFFIFSIPFICSCRLVENREVPLLPGFGLFQSWSQILQCQHPLAYKVCNKSLAQMRALHLIR